MEKNRPKVASQIVYLAQTFIKTTSPLGRTLNKFVITVAPHNDIFPHGNTYPRKAAPMVKINNKLPLFQRFDFVYDLIQIPFEACNRISMNTILQILACKYRTWCMATLFSIRFSTTIKDSLTNITTYIESIKPVNTCITI
jgi:hypothetical protein